MYDEQWTSKIICTIDDTILNLVGVITDNWINWRRRSLTDLMTLLTTQRMIKSSDIDCNHSAQLGADLKVRKISDASIVVHFGMCTITHKYG